MDRYWLLLFLMMTASWADTEDARLVASDGAEFDNFGSRVAIEPVQARVSR